VYRKQRQLTAAVRAVENRTGAHASAARRRRGARRPLEEYFRMVTATTTQRMFSLEDANPDHGSDEGPDGDQPSLDPAAELESGNSMPP
jgi:DNA-directed RNA polymerase specialized sigma subunit